MRWKEFVLTQQEMAIRLQKNAIVISDVDKDLRDEEVNVNIDETWYTYERQMR